MQTKTDHRRRFERFGHQALLLGAPSPTAEVTRPEDDEDAHSDDFSHETGGTEATPTLGASYRGADSVGAWAPSRRLATRH